MWSASSRRYNAILSKYFTLSEIYDIMEIEKEVSAMTMKDRTKLMFAEALE